MNLNEISLIWSPFHDLEFAQVGSSILFYKIYNYDGSNRTKSFYFNFLLNYFSLYFFFFQKNLKLEIEPLRIIFSYRTTLMLNCSALLTIFQAPK